MCLRGYELPHTFDTQFAAALVLFLKGAAGGRRCYIQETWNTWYPQTGDETIKTLEAIAAGLAGTASLQDGHRHPSSPLLIPFSNLCLSDLSGSFWL